MIATMCNISSSLSALLISKRNTDHQSMSSLCIKQEENEDTEKVRAERTA